MHLRKVVFELIHDYRHRIEWETLLREAYLEPDFNRPGKTRFRFVAADGF